MVGASVFMHSHAPSVCGVMHTVSCPRGREDVTHMSDGPLFLKEHWTGLAQLHRGCRHQLQCFKLQLDMTGQTHSHFYGPHTHTQNSREGSN